MPAWKNGENSAKPQCQKQKQQGEKQIQGSLPNTSQDIKLDTKEHRRKESNTKTAKDIPRIFRPAADLFLFIKQLP